MHDLGAGGGQYVTYREHIAAKEEAQKRQSALEMEVTQLRTALMHVPDDLRKLTDAVQALATKLTAPTAPAPDPAMTQAVLAMQRTLDVLSKQQPATPATELIKLLQTPPPGAGGKTWALVGALGVVAVMLGWQLLVR